MKTITQVVTSNFSARAHSALVTFMKSQKARYHFFNIQTKASEPPWRAHATNAKAGCEMHNRG
jgi:hypothetical protein